MTLLLDIDGVLMGWQGRPGPASGFDDWQIHPDRFFNYTSQTQVDLIATSFDNIQWHTTWVESVPEGGRLIDGFTDRLNFGPHPVLIDNIDSFGSDFQVSPDGDSVDRDIFDLALIPALLRGNWWKLTAIATLLTNDKLPGKVVWADDDIGSTRAHVNKVLNHFDAMDRFWLVSPDGVWTREEIEAAAEWLKS